MRVFQLCTLTVLLLARIPCLSQEPAVVHVGVAVLRSSAGKIPVTAARDRLVKALNQSKPDKKQKLPLQAVGLDESQGQKALDEAKAKGCVFVIFSHLTDLQGVDRFEMSTLQGTGDIVRKTVARVEYDLRQVNGEEYAIGSAKSETMSSAPDALMQAMERVAREVVSDLDNGLAASTRALSVSGVADSGVPKSGAEIFFVPEMCAWLPTNIPHAGSLRGACEYAITLPQKMPNFICEQSTARYRGDNNVPRDLVTAAVRYEDGIESYSDIKLDGKVAPKAVSEAPGMWSSGQFGGNLRAIFSLRNEAVFNFTGVGTISNRDAWIFSYRIARQNQPLWRFHGKDGVLAPPYAGELWVDQATGELLRFRATAKDIPPTFSVQKAELSTDYDSIKFGDGTAFDLPKEASILTLYQGEEAMRNVIEFRNCHKFKATARLVASLPASADMGTAALGSTPEDLRRQEMEESETVYSILRERAIQEDATRLEAETRQDLRTTEEALAARWSEMEKAQRAAARQEMARNAEAYETHEKTAPSTTPGGLTTLKVGVNLVQVRVVLKDARGLPVKDLRKEDFQLLDEGKPQVITKFATEVENGKAGVQDRAEGGADSDSAKPGNTVTSRGVRYVAYVFDDIHASFASLASARDAAKRQIEKLADGDRVGVFVTSGQLGINFTNDREKLEETLKNLRPHSLQRSGLCPAISPYMAHLIVNESDLGALGLATADAQKCAAGGGLDPRMAERIARSTAFEVESSSSAETQSTLGILREVVQRTAAMSGNRSIVLVTPGFLMQTPETRQGIMELIDETLRQDEVINTLDTEGLLTPTPAPNEMHSSQPVLRFRYDQEEQRSRGDVMADLAYSTGGVYFHNNNDLNEGFRRTAEAQEYLYVLGFSPQKLDGKFHKLKVTLVAKNGPKLTVQARRGYYASKPENHR